MPDKQERDEDFVNHARGLAAPEADSPVDDAPSDDISEDAGDATGASSDEDGDADGDADGDGDTTVEKKPSSKRTARDRIEELSKLRREAERAAFDLELRNVELEKRLAERSEAVPESKAPDPKDFIYGEVDPDYLSAMVDHRVAQREKQIRGEAQASALAATTEQIAERYRKRLAEVMVIGKKQHRDFDEVVSGTPFSPELARTVLDSENAVDIAYYLSNNISELRKLARATPAEQARAVGYLEGRFSATSAAKKKTTAPEPLGSNGKRKNENGEGHFGPVDQDAFDKAFFSRR